MTFRIVFDVSQQGFTPNKGLLIGPVLSMFGALLVFKPGLMRNILGDGPFRKRRKLSSWLVFLFSLLWTLTVLPWSYATYWIASSYLNSGNYSVSEGPVTNFIAGSSAKGQESFTVGSRQFSYSEYGATAGFKETVAHGGPIHEGLQVRIANKGNIILRLEIDQ